MANIVRKFQIAAEKGRLPTFGDEETAPEVDRRLTREDVSSDALRGREDVERSPHGAGDDAMLEQIRGHVRSLDKRHGREYDEQSRRISTSPTGRAALRERGGTHGTSRGGVEALK